MSLCPSPTQRSSVATLCGVARERGPGVSVEQVARDFGNHQTSSHVECVAACRRHRSRSLHRMLRECRRGVRTVLLIARVSAVPLLRWWRWHGRIGLGSSESHRGVGRSGQTTDRVVSEIVSCWLIFSVSCRRAGSDETYAGHRLTMVSLPALASRCPSGLTATLTTGPVWPVRGSPTVGGCSASYRRTVSSASG
jgi:hypothetical protein